MTSVVDLWRWVDPEARFVSGSPDRLRAAVRTVARSRPLAPHLPASADGAILVVDSSLVGAARHLDTLLRVLHDADLRPAALVLAALPGHLPTPDRAGDALPIIASALSPAGFADAAASNLEHGPQELARFAAELRLAAAEAALADPRPSTPGGLLAARLRRGAAISSEGELLALHPRAAGRALAARFAALHARLLAASAGRSSEQNREGLFLLERRIRAGASIWLFDDVPFGAVDVIAAEALTITLRALLRRPPGHLLQPESRWLEGAPGTEEARSREEAIGSAASSAVRETLLAVARANGRISPAARALGVHRNTVLYRLRRASVELGLDPRKPEDALRILAEPAVERS